MCLLGFVFVVLLERGFRVVVIFFVAFLNCLLCLMWPVPNQENTAQLLLNLANLPHDLVTALGFL